MFKSFFNFNEFMNPNGSNQSSIDKLLEEEEVSLEKLMDEQDFVSEIRYNSKLQKFMDRRRVSELLDFVIKMPEKDASHTRGHKLPFVANEVF